MDSIKFNDSTHQWQGKCSRCKHTAFFHVLSTQHYGYSTYVLLACPGGEHAFCVEHRKDSPSSVISICPVEKKEEIPVWLPDEYHKNYEEMLVVFHEKHYSSAVAQCGILLDAYLNSILPNEGEKKKTLYRKIEAAQNLQKIDVDQFSDATISRLTRNEVLHPEEILKDVTKKEAQEAIRSITEVLERAYKFRSSRALPSGEKQGSDNNGLDAGD